MNPRDLKDLDFEKIAGQKEKFIVIAKEIYSGWDEIYESVKSEYEAYLEIENFRSYPPNKGCGVAIPP